MLSGIVGMLSGIVGMLSATVGRTSAIVLITIAESGYVGFGYRRLARALWRVMV